MHKVIPISIIFFFAISCKQSTQNSQGAPKLELTLVKLDTNYLKLKTYFSNDSALGRQDKVEIPFELMRTFFKGDDSLNEESNHPINPVEAVANKYGSFFIIEIGCAAGGFCSQFYLLVFTNEGRYVGHEGLGQNAGDMGFSVYIAYKFASDTTLIVSKTEYDLPEEKLNGEPANGNDSSQVITEESDTAEEKEDPYEQKLTDSADYGIKLDTSHFKEMYWLRSRPYKAL